MNLQKAKLVCALAGVLLAASAGAATYSDNFQGTQAQLPWVALSSACLTAGNQTGTSSLANPIIPKCPTSSPFPAADAVGKGALLLTPSQGNRTGAILSAFPPFAMSQGIQITFTTYTFGGSHDGPAGNGADGIVFFLTDGTQNAPTDTGAEGGSMGYSCSNVNGKYDGVSYGYLGLGIDEWGNYLNSGDNTNTGILNSNASGGSTAHGTNTYQGGGPYYQSERIGLRGAGDTNWAWLQSQNSDYYSGSSDAGKVKAACSSGQYVSGYTYDKKGKVTGNKYSPITYNYNAVPDGYLVLPNSQPIANNYADATRNPTASTPAAKVAWPITYRLQISPTGLLNFDYSYNNGDYQPVLANSLITNYNSPLPASLRFGFSAGTGGSYNVHEITCFTASPLQANSSAGSNTVTGKVTGNTQFFLASYSQNNWWGSLVADPLVISGGVLSVGTNANWDAKCVLTGGPCDTMGVDASGNPTHAITVQSPANRTLLTSTALGTGKGTSLAWASLSSAQQTVLNTNLAGVVDNQGSQRVQWLQGTRSVEQLATPTPGNLRSRTYVLGDIINSSPTFVGTPGPGAISDTFTDLLYPAATNPENAALPADKYSAFASNSATRINMVYVGGNDGYLHGFEAGNYDSTGNFVSATNDGKELVGYMPYDVLMNKAVNLADPLYKHDYLVDATPVAGDVFYGGAWHTLLAGGVGSTGQEIYALDITDPTAFAASKVVGDWDSSTLTHLGNTVGTPIVARMHNGDWAIIFGSGLVPAGTPSPQTEGIYIGLIDPTTGAVTFQFLDTGKLPTGVNGAAGGIAYVTQADLDGDRVADYLYAGDTQGRVWRFDVTGSTPATWKQASSIETLFTAKDGSGNVQPITTSISLLAVQTGLVTRAMLYFGTGQQIQPTATSGVQYAKGQQTFYGIWDWDMSWWNSHSNAKYKALASGSTTRSNLLAQTLVAPPSPSDLTHRYLDNTKVVCWQGDPASAACSAPSQYGWMFDLPDPGPTTGSLAGQHEQIIYNPTYIEGAIVVNTAIPPTISAAQCNPGLQSGWTMAFDPASGGGFQQGFFPDGGGGFSGGSSTVGGTKLSGVGTPTSVQYGGKSYLVTQTITGAAKLLPTNPPAMANPSRVSWRELVN